MRSLGAMDVRQRRWCQSLCGIKKLSRFGAKITFWCKRYEEKQPFGVKITF
jgi:hypothetical protein